MNSSCDASVALPKISTPWLDGWKRVALTRRNGIDRRVLDSAVRGSRRTRLRCLPGQCPPRQERARPKDRRVRQPVAAAAGFIWSTQGFFPVRRRDFKLRCYWPHRDNQIRAASAHIQHTQKALEQMISIFLPQAGHSVTLRYARPKVRATQARHRSKGLVPGAGPGVAVDGLGSGYRGLLGVSASPPQALPAVLARCDPDLRHWAPTPHDQRTRFRRGGETRAASFSISPAVRARGAWSYHTTAS